ncbi:uncharacterized protein [Montipora capricornis]|uniref:uncharacterized protein n=1 Tax=Montipora capricornis TaxID=246305 RepID=UPI0035F16586
MPRRSDFEDSSSSSSRRNSSRRQHDDDNSSRGSRRRVGYGSSCGIRSLNEYQDRLINKDKKDKTAKAYVEKGDKSKAWAGAKATDHRNGHYSAGADAGASALEEGDHTAYRGRADASAEVGLGGAIVEANADATLYSYGDDDAGRIDVAKGRVGGGLGIGPGGAKAKLEASVDAVDINCKFSEKQEMDVNIGLSADTGFEAGVDGVSASVLGFGLKAGRNTGISTPFGGLSFKLW